MILPPGNVVKPYLERCKEGEGRGRKGTGGKRRKKPRPVNSLPDNTKKARRELMSIGQSQACCSLKQGDQIDRILPCLFISRPHMSPESCLQVTALGRAWKALVRCEGNLCLPRSLRKTLQAEENKKKDIQEPWKEPVLHLWVMSTGKHTFPRVLETAK